MSALHVVFTVAGNHYVLAASDVLHMESFSGATVVPGAAAYVAGLVQIRGAVIPVVDVRVRFGLPTVERALENRVVVVQSGTRAVGLLVDSARDVVKLAPEQFRPPPEMVARQAAGFVKAVVQSGPRLLLLMDFHKVIGEDALHGEQRQSQL